MTSGNYPFLIMASEEVFMSLPVAAAAIAAAVLMVLFGIMFQRKYGSLLKSDQVIEAAESNGCIVQARLVQSHYMHADMTERWIRRRQHHWIARYEYTVGGKNFSYRRVFDTQPPDTLTLYYAPGRPGHAYSRGDREPGEFFALFFAVSMILMLLFLNHLF